ncbi:MAG: hypothetical protein GY946_26975 [bacterium]|nr:hypothetical protein [bacterium]
MPRAAACAFSAISLACFIEVSGSSSGTFPGSGGLESSLEAEFGSRAGGASASIQCPSGLTGTQGHQIACHGETSDGFTLEIVVLERGGDDYRWDVVESVPIR